MRLLLIETVIALACPWLRAQELYDLDSLQQAFARSAPDTNRVKLLIQLGQQYENNHPDTAIWFYEQALKLSEQLAAKKIAEERESDSTGPHPSTGKRKATNGQRGHHQRPGRRADQAV
jgi:hypothetical protein